jgi:hypothetical protein
MIIWPCLVLCNHFVYEFFHPFLIEAGTLNGSMMILEIIFLLFMAKFFRTYSLPDS